MRKKSPLIIRRGGLAPSQRLSSKEQAGGPRDELPGSSGPGTVIDFQITVQRADPPQISDRRGLHVPPFPSHHP